MKILVMYDISNNKIRNRFSKFLKKFGCRIQYSVFEINGTKKVLNQIINDIRLKQEKELEDNDSIRIQKIDNKNTVIVGNDNRPDWSQNKNLVFVG